MLTKSLGKAAPPVASGIDRSPNVPVALCRCDQASTARAGALVIGHDFAWRRVGRRVATALRPRLSAVARGAWGV